MTTSSAITIRAATPDDTTVVAAILDRAWRSAYGSLLDPATFESSSLEFWTAALAAHAADFSTIVATDAGGKVLGFARFGADPEPEMQPAGHLASLYVDPDAGGAGVGGQLLEAAIDAVARAGWTRMTLWVFRDNARARALYERFGFHTDGGETVDPRWRVPQVRYLRSLSHRSTPSAASTDHVPSTNRIGRPADAR